MVKGLPAEWGKCSRTVALGASPWALSFWKSTIAVGLNSGGIITLDGITGSQLAVLSGHTNTVRSLAFSPDGTMLASGSHDKTVGLWDVQTGGVIETFHGHTNWIRSVSISADSVMIASGSHDGTIRLWDVRARVCRHIIEQQEEVHCVIFSPTVPQCFISASRNKIQQWDIDRHKIQQCDIGICKRTYPPVAFSSDGTKFAVYQETVVIQNLSSGTVLAEFHPTVTGGNKCCFSPDDRFVALVLGGTINVWDITSSVPLLVETFAGHTGIITSLVFSSPSTLISSSSDKSVKFWQIGILSTDPIALAPIESVTLRAKDQIAISSHSGGEVKIWDISTGHCKTSFKTLTEYHEGGVQLVGNRLISAWFADGEIHIQDTENGRSQVRCADEIGPDDLRISEDGSKVFSLNYHSLVAWSIWTGEVVGEVELEPSQHRKSLTIDGLRVWVHCPMSDPLGWDFGVPGSPPVQLSNTPSLCLSGAGADTTGLCRMKDIVTGNIIFQLGGRFAAPPHVQWDGHYLVAGYKSGEVLILDFSHILLH